MRTGITTEPIPRVPVPLPLELEYDLTPDEFAAWWTFLACKAPHRLPPRVAPEVKVFPILFYCGLTVVLGFLALACVAYLFPDSQGAKLFALIVGVVMCVVTGVLVADRPGLFIEGVLAKPFRRTIRSHLRYVAQMEAKKGRTDLIDILSHYRFAMNPEGFTHTRESQQPYGGSPDALLRRQTTVSWKMVEVAGSTGQHVFLVMDDPTPVPVIVPRSSFPDDNSFRCFAETVHSYCRTQRAHLCSRSIPEREHPFGVSPPSPVTDRSPS
jgi:hypothetical protein